MATNAPYAKHHKAGDVDVNSLIQIITPAGQKVFEYEIPGNLHQVCIGKNNQINISLALGRFFPKEERVDSSVKVCCLELSPNT